MIESSELRDSSSESKGSTSQVGGGMGGERKLSLDCGGFMSVSVDNFG